MRILALFPLIVLAGCAARESAPEAGPSPATGEAGAEPPAGRAVIEFANFPHRIDDWRADGTRGIYLRVNVDEWYYGQFMGRCHGLPFAETIGIVTDGLGQVDRFSSILIEEAGGGIERCWFRRFGRSQGPPEEREEQR